MLLEIGLCCGVFVLKDALHRWVLWNYLGLRDENIACFIFAELVLCVMLFNWAGRLLNVHAIVWGCVVPLLVLVHKKINVLVHLNFAGFGTIFALKFNFHLAVSGICDQNVRMKTFRLGSSMLFDGLLLRVTCASLSWVDFRVKVLSLGYGAVPLGHYFRFIRCLVSSLPGFPARPNNLNLSLLLFLRFLTLFHTRASRPWFAVLWNSNGLGLLRWESVSIHSVRER